MSNALDFQPVAELNSEQKKKLINCPRERVRKKMQNEPIRKIYEEKIKRREF